MSFVAIIISAFNFVAGWLFRSIVIKFVFYTALYLLATEAIGYLTQMKIFPDGSSLSSALSSFSSSVWWGLDLMGFDIGFPMVLGAYTTKFIIKLIRGMG